MRDTTRAERLLSLFTSPDRAAAIAGDLTEERERRGSAWFWLHTIRTTLALWRNAVRDAPLSVIMLAVSGCALFAAPAFAGAAAVNLFPLSVGSPQTAVALAFFWWGGAVWVGATLVVIAPRRGMAASVTLAAAITLLLMAFGLTAASRELLDAYLLLFYTTGLIAMAPLLLGAALARRRLIAYGIAQSEPHR